MRPRLAAALATALLVCPARLPAQNDTRTPSSRSASAAPGAPAVVPDSALSSPSTTAPVSADNAAPPFRPVPAAVWRADLPVDASRRAVVSAAAPHLSRTGVRGAKWGAVVGGAGGLLLGYMFSGACDSDPCGDPVWQSVELGADGALGGAVLGYGIGALVGWAHRPRTHPE